MSDADSKRHADRFDSRLHLKSVVQPPCPLVDSSVRHFEGVTYRLFRGNRVREFVLGVANAEWEPHDFETYGDDLLCSEWELREVELAHVKPNEKLLASPQFQGDLKPRIAEIKLLLQNSQAIPPLILRGSDFLIFDGYARYEALKDQGIRKCLAYVGKRISI